MNTCKLIYKDGHLIVIMPDGTPIPSQRNVNITDKINDGVATRGKFIATLEINIQDEGSGIITIE